MPDDAHGAFIARASRIFSVARPRIVAQRYAAPDRQRLCLAMRERFGHIKDDKQRMAAGLQHLRDLKSHDYAVLALINELSDVC